MEKPLSNPLLFRNPKSKTEGHVFAPTDKWGNVLTSQGDCPSNLAEVKEMRKKKRESDHGSGGLCWVLVYCTFARAKMLLSRYFYLAKTGAKPGKVVPSLYGIIFFCRPLFVCRVCLTARLRRVILSAWIRCPSKSIPGRKKPAESHWRGWIPVHRSFWYAAGYTGNASFRNRWL